MLHFENTSLNDIEGEIWKYVPGWEYYYKASNMGRIKGVQRITGIFRLWPEKIIKQNITNNGYLCVALYKNGFGKTQTVHRIIAKTHIKNPLELKFVNHKNGNKLDNRVSELEWATKSENELHKFKVLGYKGSRTGDFGSRHNRSKPIAQYDSFGNQIREFECAREASRVLNISPSHICSCLKGTYNTAGGFIFKYV